MNVDIKVMRLVWLGVMLFITACGGGGGGGQTADPLVQGFPIAYVKRSVPVDDQGNMTYPDARNPVAFNSGANLYIRDHASSRAVETNITSGTIQDLGDVKDVEVSYDGNRLLFAMRLPDLPNTDPEDQPSWNIWEYDIPSRRLRRLIAVDAFAEEGQDVAPNYLPMAVSSFPRHVSNALKKY